MQPSLAALLRQIRGWMPMLLLLAGSTAASAGERITAAVAANFAPAMRQLIAEFEKENAVQVRLVAGSTGKHYAQIRQGAPFDVFFAADDVRPARLEYEGQTVPGSRFTYAVGRLVLWSPRLEQVGPELLRTGDFEHLALANPKLAPYGLAAESVLVGMNLRQPLADKLVWGENVAQAIQFVDTGAAELGFVALAQLKQNDREQNGSYWLVPHDAHAPIRQQAVVLKSSSAAEALMAFMRSRGALRIMAQHGYEAPDETNVDD